jgi:hypothetical protein
VRAGGWLIRGVLTTLALAVLTAATIAQEGGDRLLEIDQFAGLNLYKEKTDLALGEALFAKNVQFRKPGTISCLDGLTMVDSLPGMDPTLGIGNTLGFGSTSSRILIARDSVLMSTDKNIFYFNPMYATTRISSADWGIWRKDIGSTKVYETTGMGRAAEFYRAGWHWGDTPYERGASPASYKTISYIANNATFYVDSGYAGYGPTYRTDVYPLIPGHDSPVKFVPVEVGGSPMQVVLQAGMEPMITDGSLYNTRYFGIADTSVIQRAGIDSFGNAYIVDNNQLGLWGGNEIATAGYWLHTPYAFDESDTSHMGRTWQIDSNSVYDSDDTTEFRIWFTPGDTTSAVPGGKSGTLVWLDSLVGSRYQLLSAPFSHTVLSETSSPVCSLQAGGRYAKLLTGTVTPRIADQIPHVLALTGRADTLLVGLPPDTLINMHWINKFPDAKVPVYVMRYDTLILQPPTTLKGYPVRAIYNDTVGTDSTYIWTSGRNAARASATFGTSDWKLLRLGIPFASDGVVYQDRLFLAGDPEDPNFVVFSDVNGVRGPLIGAFPIENAMRLPSNGDIFTGFAKVYGWLLFFQREHTWVLKGDPVNGGVFELALPDEGCIAANSIVELENNVIYLSEKGWRIFDGNSAKDFGLPIKPSTQALPRIPYSVNQSYKGKSAAAFDPTTGNVWLSMPFNADTVNSGSFLYNFVDGSFTYSDEVYGDNVKNFSYLGTLRTVFSSKGKFYTYGYTDSLPVLGIDRTAMQTQWSTGWMDMGSSYREKKLGDGVVHVNASSPDTAYDTSRIYVRMYRNFDTTMFYADTSRIAGNFGGKHYETEMSIRLEPPADSSTVQWLRIEFVGSGLNLMDVRRFVLRYGMGDDVIRDDTKVLRP